MTNKNAKYNLLGDFAPISQLINSPSVPLVNPGLSVNSLIDFSAKAKPGELSYASAGIGTQPHMGMELLAMMVGIRIQHIPASLKKLSRPVWQFITTDQRNSILFCPFLR